jgi:hypothetical protein
MKTSRPEEHMVMGKTFASKIFKGNSDLLVIVSDDNAISTP